MREQTGDERDVDRAEEAAAAAADNVRSMDQAKKKVAEAVDDARERFQHAAADVGERFQHVSAAAKEKSEHAREVARERYQVHSAQLQDGYARVRTDVDHVVDDVNDFVRQKPGTAVLIAAGAGFLLGLLMRPSRYHD